MKTEEFMFIMQVYKNWPSKIDDGSSENDKLNINH